MKTTMLSNGKTIVDNYNTLFINIERMKTTDEIYSVVDSVKDFISAYKKVDKVLVNRVYEKLQDRLSELIAENELSYQRQSAQVEQLRSKSYDFSMENNDTQAVQNFTLQLIAQMPKVINSSTMNRFTKLISQSIKSGTVGSKAVLELLKYPAYADALSDTMREKAFEGSKSAEQREFERIKEKECKNAEQALSSVYMSGFHMRNAEKRVAAFKKSHSESEVGTETAE